MKRPPLAFAGLGLLLIAGCGLNGSGFGDPFPRELQTGAIYRIEVVNNTACPVTLLLGSRAKLLGQTSQVVGRLSPYDRAEYEFTPEDGERLAMGIPHGYNAVGIECQIRNGMPLSVRVLNVTPPDVATSSEEV